MWRVNMISRSLALKLFEGFFIQRWNDFPRPINLTEMDKSSHKMLVAYLLGKIEEEVGNEIEWEKVILGSLFELLKKIALSDIKAPVHRRIKEKYPEEFKNLNNWVLKQYEGLIDDENLLHTFREYMVEKENMDDLSFKILRAAHKYSTYREFQLIKNYSLNPRRILDVHTELNRDLVDFLDLRGIQLLMSEQDPYGFMADVEQLRFQVRWSETLRIPSTSVLGHSYFVACLTFLIGMELNPCPKRAYNNFFCGLFHDMPEAVTRDIVQPVKHATEGLPEVIKDIENIIVEEQLIPKMLPIFKDELLYFTRDNFSNRVIINGKTFIVSSDELADKYNSNEFSPVDGEIIKLCDEIAALLEADQSIAHGVTSENLREGKSRILDICRRRKRVSGIDMRPFFREFQN
jgi:putative hydrolase of HD superfamily